MKLNSKYFKRVFQLLLFIFVFIGFSQKSTLEYSQNLTISDGLAHNGVTSILEDSKGYMWFGTYDGLNRYNGYEFERFKNTIEKEYLVSNRVRCVSEDFNGNIWIGTDQGISLFDYATEKFRVIYSNKLVKNGVNGPIVRRIIFSKDKNFIICATEGNGVLVFNKDYSLYNRYIPIREFSNRHIEFYGGSEFDKANYLFSSNIGLILLNIETGAFKKVAPKEIRNSLVHKVVNDSILVAANGDGLRVMSYKSTNGTVSFKLVKRLLKENDIVTISVDKLENLWVGTTSDGVIHINNVNTLIDGGKVKVTKFSTKNRLIRVSDTYASENFGCWVATFNRGVYRFNLKENSFKKFNEEMNYKHGLFTTEVLHMTGYDSIRFYASANKGGVGLFNTETHSFEPLTFDFKDRTKLRVANIFLDSSENLWIKFTGDMGFMFVKNGTHKLQNIEVEGYDFARSFKPVYLTEDKDKNIWAGCANNVYKLNLNERAEVESVEEINKNPFFIDNHITLVRKVYQDPKYDFMWVGSDSGGLYRLEMSGGKSLEDAPVTQYKVDKSKKHSISSNFVTSIVRLPNDELWIGTEGGGICKVIHSDTEPEFLPFTEKDGLTNNVVKSIIYDEEYNLWISTNIGLNKFDTKDNRFTNYRKENGLPFEDFTYSSVRLQKDRFVFSGLSGICYFNPNELPRNEQLPKLEFGKFKLFNRIIAPGDSIANRVLLDKSLDKVKAVNLNFDENVFSVELNSLHYSIPNNYQLKYKLSPINEEWIVVASDQRVIQYSGLQPGDYKLSVMASNSMGTWSKPKELEIIISPPYWKTPLAFVVYFLLLTLAVFAIVKIVLKIQSLNHKVEIEQLEVDAVKEVNAAKLRFFSNISHEIKTPLTLISGPVDLLLSQFKNNIDIKEKLGIIQRQSKKMLQLVDQVHDFQRADANELKMNYTHFSFNTFIDELISDFAFKAKIEKKKLISENEGQNIYVSADRNKLEKVFNNLLNNAFKYTKAEDTISVNYKIEDKDLIISVIDTGKGIDEEDLGHIFERFYQSQKKHSFYTGGSGIGLAFSKRLVEMHYGYIGAESVFGKGTTINVQLPIVKALPSEDEIQREEVILIAEKEHESNVQLINNENISNIKLDREISEAVIFYAEDNLEMRMFVSENLSKFFTVKIFSNGQELFDALEEEWPDIIITDLLMPEMNGLELCKNVKSDIKTSHIPLILLTACTTGDDRIQGIRDGADAYIKKPFNMEHLLTRTESLLQNRKTLRERFEIGIPLTKENNSNNRNDNAFLEKLYNLMAENLDNQELDLNLFAKELYLNRTHFYQKVKALTNQTPFELLKEYRLKKAGEFLIQKKLSVNEVYVMTGFKSRTHFAKLFKEKFNITPGKYAAEMKKKFDEGGTQNNA